MGSYDVIARTSETMLELLRDRIQAREDVIDVDREMIALASPDEVDENSDIRLSLHLYEVTSNNVLNTGGKQYDPEAETVTYPPLALDLWYLLPAYPSQTDDNVTPQAIGQQHLLGLAIQTLNDHASLDGTEYGGEAFEKNVGVYLQPDASSSVTEIWRSLQESTLRPSVVYEVTPVLIDSMTEDQATAVGDREIGLEDKEEPGAREQSRVSEQS